MVDSSLFIDKKVPGFGFERIDISRGSCYECVALIKLAGTILLVNKESQPRLYEELTILSKMLSGLKKSI